MKVHRKIQILIILLGLSVPTLVCAQRQKFVFAEGLGSGLLASVNFDMRFKHDARDGFGARVGYTNTGFLGDDEWISAFPVGVNYLYGKGRSGLLLGFTTTFPVLTDQVRMGDYRSVVYAPEVGYRFRPMARGVGFQVTWSPLFNTVDGAKVAWFGVGVGYAWR